MVEAYKVYHYSISGLVFALNPSTTFLRTQSTGCDVRPKENRWPMELVGPIGYTTAP